MGDDLSIAKRLAPVMLLLGGLVGTPALAQDVGISGDLERMADASPEEKAAYVRDAVVEMQDAVKATTKLLDDAKKRGDTEMIECVQDRLTQIRALAQVSELAEQAMLASQKGGEFERADHEFRKVAVALQKTRQLAAEARSCISQEGGVEGDTVVQVDGPEGDGDDTEGSDDPLDIGIDPPETSPFL